ncbi:hypothetical protein [Brevibacillus brevis]|uniref:hypothetical protein n=1 Tax=Brevibacillus brevis TaxID=1393 RepID=UPI0007D8B4B0|nr:hypothetical protein [Brevibacillus brevis]
MNTLSKEDAIFFLDAIGSTYSPNTTYRFNKRSPYMEYLKDRNSEQCRRFLRVGEVLLVLVKNERKAIVLESRWGIYEDIITLEDLGVRLGLKSNESVRYLQKKCERELAKQLAGHFDLLPKPKKKASEYVDKKELDEDWYCRGLY